MCLNILIRASQKKSFRCQKATNIFFHVLLIFQNSLKEHKGKIIPLMHSNKLSKDNFKSLVVVNFCTNK